MSEKVEPREFEFHWRENGVMESTKISAECYAEACWKLGAMQIARFQKDGMPKDFALDLISQEPGR